MQRSPRIVTGIGLFGCVLGLLCLPPVAGLCLTIEPLYPEDRKALWVFGVLLIALFGFVARTRRPVRARLAALLLPLAVLISVEMVARVAMRFLPITDQTDIMRLAHRTYVRDMPYQAHPFLHFTGRPDRALRGNDALGNLTPFNDLGFLGPVPTTVKPPQTLRVACLGGSTTARGYPARLEQFMQEHLDPDWHAETINFGMGFYCSAHIVVNLVFNAVQFSPDYAVFHEAWNDERARAMDGPVRTDYGNVFQAFQHPSIPDALLIRGSVIYRWLKERCFGEPDWAFLDTAVTAPRVRRSGGPYSDPTELIPYYQNIHTFVDVCLGRGIVPVLTTQPHTTDTSVPFYLLAVHIDQCNEVMREVAKQYGDKVLFVDAAKMLTGKNEIFIDLGHTNSQGEVLLAQAIGEAILAHWRPLPRER